CASGINRLGASSGSSRPAAKKVLWPNSRHTRAHLAVSKVTPSLPARRVETKPIFTRRQSAQSRCRPQEDCRGRPSLVECAPMNPEPHVLMVTPFVVLLLAIALMPFIHKHHWENHYPKVAMGLGLITVIYYLVVLRNEPRMLTSMV